MNEITEITPQVKDKTRCNIYIDGRFCCGLGLETVVKYRLKAGVCLSERELAQMQLDSEKNTALDKAMLHLSATRKTEKQMREFLTKKGYLPATCAYVLEKLRAYGFLNDSEYAEAYIERAARKKGGRLIKMELRGKGLSDEVMENALAGLLEEDERAAATEVANKYLKGKPLDEEMRRKTYRYLLSKGFDYDVAKQVMESIAEGQGCDE